MDKEFVTYEQALSLKELGFNEECLKLWKNITLFTLLVNPEEFKRVVSDLFTPAPLKSQVFRWFREEYDLIGLIHIGTHEFSFSVYKNGHRVSPLKEYLNYNEAYEEAENACIDKLIEIAKQQDND
jgi:hypothetical protein